MKAFLPILAPCTTSCLERIASSMRYLELKREKRFISLQYAQLIECGMLSDSKTDPCGPHYDSKIMDVVCYNLTTARQSSISCGTHQSPEVERHCGRAPQGGHEQLVGNINGSVDQPPASKIQAPQLDGPVCSQDRHDQLFQQDSAQTQGDPKQQPEDGQKQEQERQRQGVCSSYSLAQAWGSSTVYQNACTKITSVAVGLCLLAEG